MAAVALGSLAHIAVTYTFWARTSDLRPFGARLVLTIAIEWVLTFVGALTWPIGLVTVRTRGRVADGVVPVVLVHGYLMTWSNFLYLWPALARRGVASVHPVTLGRWLSSMDAQAQRLSTRIDEILARTGATRVDVVAHSMGGVLSRSIHGRDLASGRTRIRRIVTLGTPHRGTRLAELALGRGGRAMRPGSRFLASLPEPDRVISIWSAHDNLVVPAEAADPRGNAKSVRLESLGHFTLLFSPRVADLVARELKAEVDASDLLADPDQAVRAAGEASA